MGGLRRDIPLTFWLMVIGTLALTGFPLTAGYYSKDAILEAAFARGNAAGMYGFLCGTVAAFLTAFYSWRLLILTFHGTSRASADKLAHVHESPAVMLGPLVVLAIGAVAFTTAAVGVVAHWAVPGLPWAACFALGAIVSPPDAVAAKAVLQRIALPHRMVVLLEGESLVNDASGLVLYRFAVAAALTGAFSAGQAAVSFAVVSAGGIAAGAVCVILAASLLRRLNDPALGTGASLLIAWASYIAAESAGVSGVLSTVACGLMLGWRQHRILSAETRMQARAVWGVVVFALESLVFILIGLSLRGVLQRIGPDWHAALILLPQVAAVVAAVIVSRFVWMLPAPYLPLVLIPALRRQTRCRPSPCPWS